MNPKDLIDFKARERDKKKKLKRNIHYVHYLYNVLKINKAFSSKEKENNCKWLINVK